MSRNKALLAKRNDQIRRAFYQLYDKVNKKGDRLYSYESCLTKISEKFFLAPTTIKGILYSRK